MFRHIRAIPALPASQHFHPYALPGYLISGIDLDSRLWHRQEMQRVAKTSPVLCKASSLSALVCSFGLCLSGQTASVQPLPFKAPPGLHDQAELLSPSDVRMEGWLGARIMANATNRLLHVETEPILAGFRKKPGSHPWIGEHVGKWLHAATLAWAYTGDPALRQKLDRVAADLIKCQEPDGYLGTYVPEKRFGLYPDADWDVWSHKYNLMGLLTYYQYTGNEAALEACRKMGDLLIATFPAKRSILAAGTHVGMAATSVLEPVVLLYRLTGEERYLAFARYIVKSWDEPNGPKIIKTLLAEKQVNKTANGKAYEMLSNLVGLCELARASGDRGLLDPVLIAWDDICAKRLYVTGSASAGEHFQNDHVLPNGPGSHICETCVTTTWIQLNLQLLRLTGEARFAHELERTFYNHLSAAQHPQGADWCYYTCLEGKKPYDAGINCCHSSGPRGLALAPQAAFFRLKGNAQDTLAISTLESATALINLDGQSVTVKLASAFPRAGEMTVSFQMAKATTFALKVRVPPWAGLLRFTAEGKDLEFRQADGWAVFPAQNWKPGDTMAIRFTLAPRLIIGSHGNKDRAALAWGPFVLAYDEALNSRKASAATGLTEAEPLLTLKPGSDLAFQGRISPPRRPRETEPATFATFADAGASGSAFRVWLRAPGVEPPSNESLLADGQESRSRSGNQNGSIVDGDPVSFVVTFDGRPSAEDWFAVNLDTPASIKRIVFIQGRCFHDGGWFNTTKGQPSVQVRREKEGKWESVGELKDYPATTGTDKKGLKEGQKFALRLDPSIKVWAVRVIGQPACGDNPAQAFSSCAELQAFPE